MKYINPTLTLVYLIVTVVTYFMKSNILWSVPGVWMILALGFVFSLIVWIMAEVGFTRVY